jgi:hypothetical protein
MRPSRTYLLNEEIKFTCYLVVHQTPSTERRYGTSSFVGKSIGTSTNTLDREYEVVVLLPVVLVVVHGVSW